MRFFEVSRQTDVSRRPRLPRESRARLAHDAREALEELLWPTRCVGCEQPGELLCDECRSLLPWVEQRLACPRCGAPFGFLTCTDCEGEWELDDAPVPRALVAALGFEGTPARMVTNLKDAHELRLAPVMAAAMLCALEEASAWPAADGLPRYDPEAVDGVCFVPATTRAYARRGFDHMGLVARELCAQEGLPLADVLVRPLALDQRSLGREDRAANLAGSVRAVEDLRDMRLLLLDDVATTGSSLRESTRALLARGAESVTACVLARVW